MKKQFSIQDTLNKVQYLNKEVLTEQELTTLTTELEKGLQEVSITQINKALEVCKEGTDIYKLTVKLVTKKYAEMLLNIVNTEWHSPLEAA